MTIEQFLRLFPDSGLTLRYLERGPAGDRKRVWEAEVSAGYFTTDTDRLSECRCDEPASHFGIGETVEEALDGVAREKTLELRARTEGLRQRILSSEQALRDFEAQLERATR